jgi:hypothetical protein
MTDVQTLLQLAARCRRMAGRCSTAAIARKFEALALDYEEHAGSLRRNPPGGATCDGAAPDMLPVPSGRPRPVPSAP